MCNSLRIELVHHGVAVGTIHPSWINTPMVREGHAELRAFHRLRAALMPPFSRISGQRARPDRRGRYGDGHGYSTSKFAARRRASQTTRATDIGGGP